MTPVKKTGKALRLSHRNSSGKKKFIGLPKDSLLYKKLLCITSNMFLAKYLFLRNYSNL